MFDLLPRRTARSVLVAAAMLSMTLTASSLPAVAGEPIFPPGYSVGLAPPEGMLPAGDFVGFEDQSAGAAITLYDLPAEAFERISEDFTIEGLLAQGIEDPERSDVAIEGASSAVMIAGRQLEHGVVLRKWILLATTDERAALIVGEMIADNPNYDEAAMRDALLTLTFRNRPSLAERNALLRFRVGDRAEFRPIESAIEGSVLLIDGDGDEVTESSQPIIVIAPLLGEIPPRELRDDFARGLVMGMLGLQEVRIERSEAFRQRNDDWHEIVAQAKNPDGEDLILMQTLRFTREGLLRTFASVRLEDRAEFMPRFRRVADSVEPR